VKEHRLAALMTSHVLAPSLDPGLPVTLSSRVQKDYLRDTLGFGGIVLTDDINMRALTEGRDPEKAAVMAIAAGADMIMYLAEDIAGIHAALVRAVQETAAGASGDGGLPTARVGGLSEARLDEAVTRIIEQKLLLDLWNRSRELTEAVITAGGTEARGPAASEGAALGRRLEEFGRLKAEGDALLRRIKAP
jgi:beta-N-acetylhexosaminidase